MRPPERIALGDILLRRWTRADVTPLHTAVIESFEILRPWMPWAAQRPDPVEQRTYVGTTISQWDADEAYIYGIFATDDGQLLGTIGLHDRVEPGGLEIGYWLHADHTGKGLATRAAEALTEAAFALPGIERVEIHCDEANTASAAIPQRLGYHLARTDSEKPEAPAETGRRMIWIKTRQRTTDREPRS
ncbi:GNAT family N-acetyltransferase [Actinomadura syzygii]|uniref:GNAT family N-acetyltransferase n=1 Tax=Actinomadura syzygii TaxID=1427538 RepID=A0A5D0UM01_9ACTN|nr:GNAT family N-acetyltransferase [Actinomadura syzygii]TYC18635.1 GNAT family N-acetyltransferase [Actinomadura syzygii]